MLKKFKARLSGLAWQASRLPDLYQRHGGRRLLSEAISRLTRRPRAPVAPPPALNEQAARVVLAWIMRKLEIAGEAGTVLENLHAALGERAYQRSLQDLYALQRHLLLAEASQDRVVPFTARLASNLPEAPARRRRILFVTAHFPAPWHGGGSRILNFLKPLSRENDIYLATSFIKGEDDRAVAEVEPFCRSMLRIPFAEFGGNQGEIRRWLGGQAMDIVHYEWPRSLENYDPAYGGRQIFTYMEAVSLRLLMDLRGMQPASAGWLATFAALIGSLRVELEQAAALDLRVAVTKRDAEFFLRLNPRQEVMVLNHGLDFEVFSLPEVSPEPATLVFTGNFAHYPNLDAMHWFFREVWPGVRAAVPDARLLMVGNRPPSALKRLADGEHVIVTGSVPDVRPYIQQAAVCIAPLVSGAGLRGKVIEYAALRRPFVATSIAVEDLVFREGVDFLHADRAEDFTAAVIGLLKDPARAAAMGAEAYETARANYDMSRLVDYLQRIYAYLETSWGSA